MKELNEYRAKLLKRLVEAAHEFREACLVTADALTPFEAGGWNVHQLAAHTRDVEQLVYGVRARRTMLEDNPGFANFDSETHAREHYAPAEPLTAIVDELVQHTESLAGQLSALPPEAWARVSSHEKLGHGLTLQLWVERGLAHIEEHLATIKQGS